MLVLLQLAVAVADKYLEEDPPVRQDLQAGAAAVDSDGKTIFL